MRQWLNERRVAEQTRRRLEGKANEWVRFGRETAGLLDEVELKEASDWLNSPDAADIGYDENLPQLVQRSRDVLEETKREKDLAQQRQVRQATELAEAQKQRAEEAERLNQEIDNQRRISDARRLAAQAMFMQGKNFDMALLLSVEACKLDISVETRRSLLDLLTSKPQLRVYLHPPKDISSPLAFSLDGTLLASGRDDTIRLWDISTRQLLGDLLTEGQGSAKSLAFSPDGKTLASGSHGGTILLWDVARRQPLGDLLPKHPDTVRKLTLSPDSKTLASGSDGPTIVLWNVASRQPLGDSLTGNRHRLGNYAYRPENSVGSLTFSPDGKTLAFGSGSGDICFWDVASRQLAGNPLKGQQSRIESLAFSPDGKTLASGSEHGTLVRMDALPLMPLSSYGSILLWDVASRQLLGDLLTGGQGSAKSLAFSPNGKTLASGSHGGSIQLWDVASRQPMGDLLTGHVNAVESLAFHQDGEKLRSGSEDGTILLWDVVHHQTLGNRISERDDPAGSLAFSPDGKTLAWGSRGETILLWDVTSQQPMGDPLTGQRGRVESLAFSPDGKTVASANDGDTILLWDVASRQTVGVLIGGLAGDWMLSSLAFSPDGKTLAAGSWGHGNIILWDVASRQPLGAPLTGQPDEDADCRVSWATGVQSVAFSPDGKTLASGHGNGTITLWDVARRKQLRDPLTGHSSSVASVAFSPDGKTLASGSHDDTILLWDVVSCQPRDPLNWPQGRVESRASSLEPGVLSVAFSADGKTLASGNGDGTIALWDVASHQLMGDPLTGPERGVTSVVFSPDGKTLASGSGSGSLGSGDIWLWDLDLDSWKERACRIANRNLTRAEWAQYVNSEPFTYDRVYAKNITCPGSPLELPPHT
jgi:WD40 repeat protein